VLAGQGQLGELAEAVLHALPAEFAAADLDRVLAEAHRDLLTRPGAAATAEQLRKAVLSAYTACFAPDSGLSQRVLLPSADEERNGMEDARFTRFRNDDGTHEYRATYTAYDGSRIAPRLLISSDLRVFRAYRLAGTAARNKGMALFPRPVHGQYLALCRSDGERTSLARSADGYQWADPVVVQEPAAPWELLQVGNCGSPIETDQGWLVLTHGVGPMRVYVIGALLLDLDDPSRVIGRSASPLLSGGPGERDGYVPSVVYSCGAFLHDGLLWIPYGIDDSRIAPLAYSSVWGRRPCTLHHSASSRGHNRRICHLVRVRPGISRYSARTRLIHSATGSSSANIASSTLPEVRRSDSSIWPRAPCRVPRRGWRGQKR
jgi:predicted GH43/DUF377 family glycosyl hydrolase